MKSAAPGKLIISGEHSVVYGAPALAVSIDRYVTAELTRNTSNTLILSTTEHTHTLPLALLQTTKQGIEERYQAYQHNRCAVSDILQHPLQLAEYVVALFYTHFNLPYEGLHIALNFGFPVGSGMGASAAFIVSLLHALDTTHQTHATSEVLYHLALRAENCQHGQSSGLDCYMSLWGGFVIMQSQHIERHSHIDLPLYFEFTGKPDSSTGECVNQVKHFKNDTALWQAFTDVTLNILEAIKNKNIKELGFFIRENHRLLCRIGVVPEATQARIHALEKQEISAKISGAGSIRGNHAGALLLVSETPLPHSTLIRGESHGVHSLSSHSSR